MMMQAHFSGMDNMYEILDWVKELTLPGLEARLRKDLDPEYGALSVIKPA